MNTFLARRAFGFFTFTYWQGWRSFTPPVLEFANAA
jgi:hypothetical protein